MVNENYIEIEKELFEKAEKGDISILDHPYVATIKNINGYTPLHVLALKGVKEVLNKSVMELTQKNKNGDTVLHLLAAATGCDEVLNHFLTSILINNWEYTPLHYLAIGGNVKILLHTECDSVKNIYRKTPLYYLIKNKIDLLEKYEISMDDLDKFSDIVDKNGYDIKYHVQCYNKKR